MWKNDDLSNIINLTTYYNAQPKFYDNSFDKVYEKSFLIKKIEDFIWFEYEDKIP